MQFILLADVALYYRAVTLMEISENLKQLFVGLVYPAYQVGELILFEVLAEGAETVFHELVDFDGVVVFM